MQVFKRLENDSLRLVFAKTVNVSSNYTLFPLMYKHYLALSSSKVIWFWKLRGNDPNLPEFSQVSKIGGCYTPHLPPDHYVSEHESQGAFILPNKSKFRLEGAKIFNMLPTKMQDSQALLFFMSKCKDVRTLTLIFNFIHFMIKWC